MSTKPLKHGSPKSDLFGVFQGLRPKAGQGGPKDPSRHPPRSKSYLKMYLNGCPKHDFFGVLMDLVFTVSPRLGGKTYGGKLPGEPRGSS